MAHFFNNLRVRLILLVLLAVIPAMGITLAAGLEQRRLAMLNAQEDALRLTRAVVNYQMSIVEGARQLIQAMAFMPDLQPSNTASCSAFLRSLHGNFPIYTGFIVADLQGKVICASIPQLLSTNISDRGYFQEALRKDDLVIGSPTEGRATGRTILPFALPLRDANNQRVGVLVISQDLQILLKMTQTMQMPDNSVLLLVDQTGMVLLRYPQTEKYSGLTLPNEPIIQQILNTTEEGHVEVTGLDGVNRFYAFTPLVLSTPLQMHISVGIPATIVFANVDRLMWFNLLGILLIALLALLAAWFGGDRLVLRIVSLTAERDEAERKLLEMNHELEARVAQRTAELGQTNQQLQSELAERKKMLRQLAMRERELNAMLAHVERSNQELQNFAYIASHDLQEPLRKIQAFGDRLARRYSDQLSVEGADFIQRMNSAASRMQLMINDLLNYSRVTTRPGAFIQVNLNEVIEEAVSNVELRITETNGQVLVDDLPVIEADPSQMRQLFQNLIGNALKFHRSGVPPVVRINVTPPESGEACEYVTLAVEDNGIGFDEKYLDRIFIPFQRLHPREQYEGSGIGLAICRRIVERHAGQLTAHSTPGVGSRFIITLPIHQVSGESEQH